MASYCRRSPITGSTCTTCMTIETANDGFKVSARLRVCSVVSINRLCSTMPTVIVIKYFHDFEIIRCSTVGCSRGKPFHATHCLSSTLIELGFHSTTREAWAILHWVLIQLVLSILCS
ncbi:d7.1 [Ichnoviriform fugitivi]|uniref:D7.1 n=1 Tax=Ichnoviriform fugitivi TaxID=265522 RepID=A2Q0L4_9VIRU|nr:d7.1 [Ichnoviriform fugitivi]BAF45729.1 d7.1 [Ichnoviriform fugitivi]